jgi:chromosome segregation ATPase
MTNNREGSTDSYLQAKLHTILQQNNFLKGEQDKLSAELAQQKGEIHVVKCDSESARDHMKHQAERLEERERDVSTLHKEFSRMKINFKNIQSTQAEMNKKLEYTYGLNPTYLAGLQQTRGILTDWHKI